MSNRIPYSDGAVGGAIVEINDIINTPASEGDVLQYSSEGEWVAAQVERSGQFESLSDVEIDTNTLQVGQGISWDGENFVNNSVINGQSTAIDGLDDVEFSAAPTEGQLLVYSSGKWRPGVVNADGSIAMGIATTAREQSVIIGSYSNSAGARSVCVGVNNASSGPVTEDLTLLGISAGQNSVATGVTAVGYRACQNNSSSNATAIGTRAAQNGSGTESVSIGYYSGVAGGGTGNYSISLGPNCTAQGSNSIAISATEFSYTQSASNAFFINPANIGAYGGLGSSSNVYLMYDTVTGRISRQTKTMTSYDASVGGSTNTTGISCTRDVTRNGRYLVKYSLYSHATDIGDYPIIQVSLYTREEDEVGNSIIRNANVSYDHDTVNQWINVYAGSGTTFRNDLHFSLVCLRSQRVPYFHINAGGEGDPILGDGVTRSITSFGYA
ncbi:hypothetical protein [Pleurochrysis sp. Polinton-like virus]|nr:hypothetical protein [Pleurochrysis sp. Polinton-like virus]